MTLHDILQKKGTDVFSTGPGATLAEAIRSLVDHGCGSLVVLDGGESTPMVGILTERDILRACSEGLSLDETPVRAIMTCDVITGHVECSLADTMGLMTEKRIRHLPIVEEGRLVGIVSIGDVVKAQHHRLSVENHYLKNYIQG